MTSISPSQEAREWAARLEGFKPGDLGWRSYVEGLNDNAFGVQAFATFEAQIEARRTPPSDELRRRIEDLISAAMNSAITEEWEVARHTADAIIALMPSGGRRCQCGFPWGADPVRHAEFCDNRVEAPTVSPEQVEGIEQVALDMERAVAHGMSWISASECDEFVGRLRRIAAMPSPLPSDLVKRLRKLLEEATQDVPKGAGWLWPSLAKNRAQIELRNWQSYLPALLDAIEGKKS